ncbi:MAG TPA: dihydrolipoyl dehydrogenase [Candidatus Paceibacterota bacterium]|nr:dihydrolipoyl dehydrogenase [Verrucomicrobiota bacterium]HRZ43718.1 dihydrolipoyl dehydrogenase [Candidatus Paceibacterota bacterium]
MAETRYDLAIIGGGPGGYVAAIRAAQRGMRVLLIEGREPGGVCLHAGCIPTKSLLASADVVRGIQQAIRMGIEAAPGKASWPAMVGRMRKVVAQSSQGLKFLLGKNGVECLRGWARLAGPDRIEVRGDDGAQIREVAQPGAILLATGSRPIDLPAAPRDGVRILQSQDLLRLEEQPAELVIIGGGYIGCEYATLFSTLGARVTVVEGLSRLLPGLDRDLGQALERSMAARGIQVITGASVANARADGGTVEVGLAGGRVLQGSHAVVCVGRIPRLDDLGLENAGVRFGPRGIEVDGQGWTNVPGIGAIGDVTGRLPLAHVASAEARCWVDRWARRRKPGSAQGGPAEDERWIDYDAVPACVFTQPEIATAGLSEEAASQRGLDVRIGRFPMGANGKAMAMGETEGFVKLVAEAGTGRLLGGHIAAAHAAEMIGAVAVALSARLTVDQLAQTVFPHPTLGEAIQEAAESVRGLPIHFYARR